MSPTRADCQSRRDGFTLIELLITIVIIGILATIAVVSLWRAKDQGIAASLQSDLRNIAAQQETYFQHNLQYATTVTDLTELSLSAGVSVTIPYAAKDGWSGITAHPAIPQRVCGLRVGAAPAADIPFPSSPGSLVCGDPSP